MLSNKFIKFLQAISYVALLSSLLALPDLFYYQAQAQTLNPSSDPFALTDEKLRMFRGYEGEGDLNSLFDGRDMKYNGMFTPLTRQLGGATPSLTAPIVDNEEEVIDRGGPTLIRITSEYSPQEDLTKDSVITLNVTLSNIGENVAEDVFFYACIQDNYIVLLDDPAPSPPFTNDPTETIEDAAENGDEDAEGDGEDVPIGPEDENAEGEDEEGEGETEVPPSGIQDPTVNDCYMRLEWNALEDGSPITIEPGEDVTFSWSFQPQKDDVVLRWRLVAEYGAGASYLRHWIPVKNPNPTGGVAPGPGGANGIPASCADTSGSSSQPFPEGSSNEEVISAMETRWSFDLEDGAFSWRDPRFLPNLKVLWDTLSAVECTPFLQEIYDKHGGRMSIYGTYAAAAGGDYGLTHTSALSLNLEWILNQINAGTPAKASWLYIHEMSHAYNNDRFNSPTPEYWVEFQRLHNSLPAISGYGSGDPEEHFADVNGYYVARCALEDGGPNPYSESSSGRTEFYQFAKNIIFGGQEFGPPAPSEVTC